MSPDDLCAKCGHERQHHEPRLGWIECTGEPMDDDQPRWVSGSTRVCPCDGFVEAEGKAAA